MRPRMRSLRTVVWTLVALIALPAIAAAERLTFDSDKVSIYNLVGEVDIVRSDGETYVEIEREGDDAGDLEIHRGTYKGRQTLQIYYPARRVRGIKFGSRTTLRVDDEGRFGDGSVDRGKGHKVTIGGGGGMDARAHLTIGIPDGGDLAVYLAVGSMEANGVNADLRLDSASADVLTSSTKGSLLVDTGSGSVGVKMADGDLAIDTGSGDVFVTEQAGGNLLVDTGSGSVVVRETKAERIGVDTGSGSVTLTGLESSDVMVDTGSGRVDLELLSDVERIHVDTGSGNVTMKVPDDLGAEFYLDTGSGRIRIAAQVDDLRQSRRSASGVLGDGRGRIGIETGSGNVTIR